MGTGVPAICRNLTPALQEFVRETSIVDRRIVNARTSILAPDGDPDLWRDLVGQFVDRQGRGQADDLFGHQPADRHERLLGVVGSIG